MTEQVALASARDEAAQRELLAEQAQTRLDETSRLLEQGRANEADRSAERYAETVERASVGAAERVDARLRANRARLTELLENAPPQARRGLERALVAAEGEPRAESPRPATDSESRLTSPPFDKTRTSAPADAQPEAAPTPSTRASGPRTTSSRQEAAAVEHTEARRAAGGSPSDVKRLPPPAVDRSTTRPTSPGQARRSNRP
jgi:hypothetical protein